MGEQTTDNSQQSTVKRQELSLTPRMNFRPALLILFLATVCNAYGDKQCGGKNIFEQQWLNNKPCSKRGQSGTCRDGHCWTRYLGRSLDSQCVDPRIDGGNV